MFKFTYLELNKKKLSISQLLLLSSLMNLIFLSYGKQKLNCIEASLMISETLTMCLGYKNCLYQLTFRYLRHKEN